MDTSAQELKVAPVGSYDEYVVCDVADFQPQLRDRFDLVLSWQVFEHVADLNTTIANIRTYLKPGGCLVAQLSGRFSVFGIMNQVIPNRLAAATQSWLLGRDPDTVFPAHYDRCSYEGLRRILGDWSAVEILPRYRAAGYLAFSTILERTYLMYEDWVATREYKQLATHYLVRAVR